MNIKTYSPCFIIVMILSGLPALSFAQHWDFEPAQLGLNSKSVDLSIFEKGGQLPGTYFVDIFLNGDKIDSRQMVFNIQQNDTEAPDLNACLVREQLNSYGIKVEDYPGLFSDSQCARFSAIPQASEKFLFNALQVILSVPQAALRPKPEGIAPQPLWNDGINAFRMNYRTNVNYSAYRDEKITDNARYVQLEPGGNIGAWRLRNMITWQKQANNSGKWQSAYTYAERGLNSLKSRLTLGERYTSADVFDMVPFRGGMLASDDNMVSYTEREFAPAIRGIARTQARIEVKQSGYIIYSTTVAPGPFELTGISGSSSGSDLEVTVYETDGKPQVFTVFASTPAIALQKGYLKYSIMTGQYRPSDSSINKVAIGQATAMYGLPWGITAFGGLQWTSHYQAGAVGVGTSFNRFGALSVDGIQSKGERKNEHLMTGQMWRLRYSNVLPLTGSGISISNQRYTSGFSTLSNVLDSYQNNNIASGYRYPENSKRRNRSSVMLSQFLGRWGYLNLTGIRESYWHKSKHGKTLTASYSTNWQNINWSLNLTRRQDALYNQNDREISLWVSLPLERWLGGDTQATYRLSQRNNDDTRHETGINGSGFNKQLRWDVRQKFVSEGHGASSDGSLINLNWNGTYGTLSGGYSYANDFHQMNAGLAGSVLVHQNGITFGQPAGQTVALVEAPGAYGTDVSSWPGVKTDYRGYTTLGYLTPYKENVVMLDPTSLPQDVEVPQTDVRVIPTMGAIIPASFMTLSGGRAAITLKQRNGISLPFGAVVSLAGQEGDLTGAGIVGENGEVYMTGLPESGHLHVSWGKGIQCQAYYQLPKKKGPAGVYSLLAQCS